MYVVGYGKASKSDKNMVDSRYYLTMVRSGTYTHASVPFMFIGSGKNMNNYFLQEAKLVSSHGVTAVLNFWLNENKYMKDTDWIISKKYLCKGIRALPVSLCFYFMYYIFSSLLTLCDKYYKIFPYGERSHQVVVSPIM